MLGILRVVLFGILLHFTVACLGSGSFESSSPSTGITLKPFSSFSFTEDDTVNHAMTVGSLAESRSDYGYAVGNAALRGHFRFATDKLIFERDAASADSWADHIFITRDNNSGLRHQLKKLVSISVQIKAQLNADDPGLATGCGIAFAFGDGAGHASAANLGASMRLAGRDWAASANADKTPRDYFRVIFETAKDAEKLTIDAPINSYNAASAWTNFTASQWRESASEFNVMRSTSVATAGDYITYRQDMVLNAASGLMSITITPLESNLDMSQWQAQTVTWEMYNPVSTLSTGGSARGGLDLTNVTGASAMSFSELAEQEVTLGFVGNLAPRLCEFSELKILKRQ